MSNSDTFETLRPSGPHIHGNWDNQHHLGWRTGNFHALERGQSKIKIYV